MSHINEKTMVPLGWVLAGLATLILAVAYSAFWVRGVNDRLARIEQYLKIPEASRGLLQEAEAGN